MAKFTVRVLIAAVFLFCFAGICLAMEFSADMVNSAMGAGSGKVYFKADKMRMEMRGPPADRPPD